MDVIVVDIPVKFGMLLSRSWSTKLNGTLQMDLSYAIVPVFGEYKRLYIDVRLSYMVRNKDKSVCYPIYSMEIELGSSIFYNDELYKEENQNQENLLLQTQSEDIESKQEIDQEGL